MVLTWAGVITDDDINMQWLAVLRYKIIANETYGCHVACANVQIMSCLALARETTHFRKPSACSTLNTVFEFLNFTSSACLTLDTQLDCFLTLLAPVNKLSMCIYFARFLHWTSQGHSEWKIPIYFSRDYPSKPMYLVLFLLCTEYHKISGHYILNFATKENNVVVQW